MITSETQTRNGLTTLVTVTSSLTPPVYFFWYLDGDYLGVNQSGVRSFALQIGDQARVDVLDSTDPDFDVVANAPVAYAATRTLAWVRSIDPTIGQYRIEQQEGIGTWEAIGYVADNVSTWEYRFETGRLDDLTNYGWRIVPTDIFGNDGTPLVLPAELIVRTPDAPAFSVSFDAVNDQVGFAAA